MKPNLKKSANKVSFTLRRVFLLDKPKTSKNKVRKAKKALDLERVNRLREAESRLILMNMDMKQLIIQMSI